MKVANEVRFIGKSLIVTEFEKLCAKNRERDDVQRLNEHLRKSDEDNVQNLNTEEK